MGKRLPGSTNQEGEVGPAFPENMTMQIMMKLVMMIMMMIMMIMCVKRGVLGWKTPDVGFI